MKSEPIVIENTVNAPASKVWKALTNLEDIRKWYFDIKEFKPEVGFKFQFEGGDEKTTYLHLCEVKEIIPNKKLSYSWTYEVNPVDTLVTFELFPEVDQTKVKLTHTGVEGFDSAKDPNFKGESFVQGWTYIVGTGLKEYVEKN